MPKGIAKNQSEKSQRISEKLKGRKMPKGCGFKKGHKDFRTPEGIKEMSRKKRLNPKKGKNINCIICDKEFYVQINNLNSRKYCSLKCRNVSMKGKIQTQETIEKRIKSLTGKKRSKSFCLKMSKLNTGRKPDLKTRNKMRNSRLNYMELGIGKMFNTKPELKMKELLNKLGIEYIFQKRIINYMVDFYIPNKNLIIECDGNYWHNYPTGLEKDRIRDERLKLKGYQIIRFWESEINKMSVLDLP